MKMTNLIYLSLFFCLSVVAAESAQPEVVARKLEKGDLLMSFSGNGAKALYQHMNQVEEKGLGFEGYSKWTKKGESVRCTKVIESDFVITPQSKPPTIRFTCTLIFTPRGEALFPDRF